MRWREYHEATKHSVESLRRAPRVLDWANMPDPFRHYEGVPVLDLPADPPAPEIPAIDVLQSAFGTTPADDGPPFLSQLLFYSAAISASKLVPSTGDTVCAKSESVLRESAPDGIPLPDTGPEGVARWNVSLRSVQTPGGAARTRWFRNEGS